jgi:nucleoid-associated protein EbfC
MLGGNMGKYGKQFQDMQKQIEKVQSDLKERVVEGTSGGGMVKAKVNGQQEVVDVKIEKEVINPDDKSMLEDLILAAVNEAVKKSKKLQETEMQRITGMMMPPGMF